MTTYPRRSYPQPTTHVTLFLHDPQHICPNGTVNDPRNTYMWPLAPDKATHNTCDLDFECYPQHICPNATVNDPHNTCDLSAQNPVTHHTCVLCYRNTFDQVSGNRFPRHIWPPEQGACGTAFSHNTFVSITTEMDHKWPTTHLAGNGPWNNTSDINPK